MRIRNFKWPSIARTVAVAVALGLATSASSQGPDLASTIPLSNDYVPVVNPTSRCAMGEIRVPAGMNEYHFLSNDDCSAYFVLPPAVVKNSIDTQPSGNLALCEPLNMANELITLMQQQSYLLVEEALEIQQNEKPSRSREERIEKLYLQRSQIQELVDAEIKRRDQLYGDIEGATFSVLLDSRVKERDLIELSRENERVLVNNGQYPDLPPMVSTRPHFIKAKVQDSIYSFIYRSPESREGRSSILWSTIPGLEILQQEGAKMASAHVKGGDVLSGELGLSLPAVCGGVKEVARGVYELHSSNSKPIFTVNRSYKVQQQFRYGYEAALVSDKFVAQISKEIINHNNQGFSKDQVFTNQINGNLDSFLTFNWSSNLSTEAHEYTAQMIQDIKASVFAKFADDYFDALVQSGKLEVIEPSEVAPAEGGFIDADRTGNRCWTERRWLFGRRTKCESFTYKVKEWRDGYSEEDLTTTLNIDGNYRENVNVNEMVPFYFTSTFQR